jgi:hypothetical protein
MPAIGKFRPALQSMDATVPGFHRVTPQGNLGPKSNLPGYTAPGGSMLPKNFNACMFAGSPLTPNALKRHPWLSH